jgi:hypothetical protein
MDSNSEASGTAATVPGTVSTNGTAVIPGDTPILKAEDDLLGRLTTASVVASEIRVVDPSEGYVIGILGPWGSGKTSLINLTRAELGQPPVITILEFNPWMFSGAEQLVESFFHELAAQLRVRGDRLARLAEDLEAYGEIFAPLRYLPIVGPWIERLRGGTRALRELAERRRGGAAAARNRIVKRLRVLDQPLVVVVDDIDRLRAEEIRDIFKLVRLTANFPNVIYLLAFDRARVEHALTDDGITGRAYLEKILQLVYDVPLPPQHVLSSVLTQELDRVLEHVSPQGPWQKERWPDVFAEIIRPLVRNVRDVRRYAAAVHATATSTGEHVALVDVLGLEAIRIFLPDVFDKLIQAQTALTATPAVGFTASQEPPELKQSVLDLVEAGGTQAKVVRSMIERLFPAAERYVSNTTYGSDWLKKWLRNRLVAHPDILEFYLQRVAGAGLKAFIQAERAFAVLGDPIALNAIFDSIDSNELEAVIERLEVYEGEYPTATVGPAITVLLNRVDSLPKVDRGMFSVGPRLVVARVVLRMLRQLADESERETIVRDALSRLTKLSAKRELLRLVGYEENAGHKLVPQSSVEGLDSELRVAVRAASATDLASEGDLLHLLWWTRRSANDSEPALTLPTGDGFELALLLDAVTETKSQSIGSRAVLRAQRLAWDPLVEVIGGAAAVGAFLEKARAAAGADSIALATIDLAERYAAGWKPPEFGDLE